MDELKENIKQKSPVIRQPRKSGGSLIMSLTEFVEENGFYAISKNGNNILLTKVEIEIPKVP